MGKTTKRIYLATAAWRFDDGKDRLYWFSELAGPSLQTYVDRPQKDGIGHPPGEILKWLAAHDIIPTLGDSNFCDFRDPDTALAFRMRFT